MANTYWSDWYSGWGFMLWFGFIFLVFSSMGNWGYTYQAHRSYKGLLTGKDANNILAERYARGEIDRSEFLKMKEEIATLLNDKNVARRANTTYSNLEPKGV